MQKQLHKKTHINTRARLYDDYKQIVKYDTGITEAAYNDYFLDAGLHYIVTQAAFIIIEWQAYFKNMHIKIDKEAWSNQCKSQLAKSGFWPWFYIEFKNFEKAALERLALHNIPMTLSYWETIPDYILINKSMQKRFNKRFESTIKL